MILRCAWPGEIPLLQRIEKAARSRYLMLDELSFAASTPPIAAGRLIAGDMIVAEENGRIAGFVLT